MTTLSVSHTTVLLLVSDPLMRDVLSDVLDTAGYTVVVTGDLGKAVDRLREMRFDLLVTRPYINSMAGQTAADYLRTKQPGLPVLVISGFMEDDRVRNEHSIENFYVFPKPFARADLLNEVERVLRGRRQDPVAT